MLIKKIIIANINNNNITDVSARATSICMYILKCLNDSEKNVI